MVAGIVLEYFKLLFLAIFMFTFCLLLLLTFPQVYLVCVYAQGHIHILDISGGEKEKKEFPFTKNVMPFLLSGISKQSKNSL